MTTLTLLFKIENTIDNAKRFANLAADNTTNQTQTKQISNILNAEYNLGKLNVYMELLKELDFKEYVTVAEKSKNEREEILRVIEMIYEIGKVTVVKQQ